MYKKNAPLLITVFLLCTVEFLQSGMVAFGAVPIMGEIGAGPEEYSVVAALYACMAVVAISKQRWLTERLGWRIYVLGSAFVFVIGATICGNSERLLPFTVGRVVMGIGGGAFMTAARVLVNRLPAGVERFAGIKVFATALAGGTAAAPFLASVAVTEDSWHSIFWILIGVVTMACVIGCTWLPTDRHPVGDRTSSSVLRLGLLVVGAFALPYAIQRTPYEFYSETPVWIALVASGTALLYVFFHVEHGHDRPLLNIRALLAPRYVLGVALFGFCYVINGADNYMLPIFLQRGLGYSWQTTGKFQALGLCATLVTWLVMALMLPKYPSPKKYLVVGFSALALFGVKLSSLDADANMLTDVFPALALNGCFVMLVLSTAAMQTFRDVPTYEPLMSHAQQVKNMLAQVATAGGTALAAVLLQWRSTVQYGNLNGHFVSSDSLLQLQLEATGKYFARTSDSFQASQTAFAQLAQEIAHQATLVASVEYFRFVAVTAVVALIASIWQDVFR